MSSAPSRQTLSVLLLRNGDAAPLQALLGGRAQESALRTLATRWWSRFGERGDLHPLVFDALAPVAEQLATAFTAEAALSRPDHPCWQWLRIAHDAAVGFHPELGRGGERLLAELAQFVAQLGALGWADSHAALAQYWQREQERLGKLEQRLEAVERGQWQARQAQQIAARQLNRSMGGRALPAAAVDFLQGEWYRELQWCQLTHGEQSDAWQQRANLTDALVASLQPPTDDAARQPLYALIAEVGPALRELLSQRVHGGAQLDQQLASIEQQHLRLLHGDTPEPAPFRLIDNPELWPDGAALSSELMAPLQQLAEGDWLFDSSADGRRLRLARRLEPWQQLLFVNRIGARVELLGLEAVALRIAVGDLRPLTDSGCVEQLTLELLQQLIDSYRLQQKRRAEAQQAAEAREHVEQAARDAAREEARQKALAEAAAAAARQAEAEARRAAAEQQREAEQRQQQAEREAQQAEHHQRQQQARDQEQARRLLVTAEGGGDQRRREARSAVSLLTVGDWLELRDELGGSQRLKLAVKLPSSGRLLLVDREGIKRADLTADELTEQLATGAATILASSPRFEDTLARVVNGLRRERGPRE